MFSKKHKADTKGSIYHDHQYPADSSTASGSAPPGPPPQYTPPASQQNYRQQPSVGSTPILQPQHQNRYVNNGVGNMQGYNQAMPKSEGQLYQEHLMAQCARGNHSYRTRFGIVGIILAVICFPIGMIALCCDKKEICTRCGHQTF